MLTNENNWTLPKPTPEPTPKKRGILFLSPEDMQGAKKSMTEKNSVRPKMSRMCLFIVVIDFFASCLSSGLRNRIPLFFGVGLGVGSGSVQSLSLLNILFNSDSACSTTLS